jgi:2-polyprenyl-3-methyl-5-hydroxy-6-metoxy-1,4-benzoquinol methylase
MRLKSILDTFITSSYYTDPVDIKKLNFIFSAIDRYTTLRKKAMEDLRILEVGCGRGGITFPLASLGSQVRAFDVDTDSVGYVQTQISKNKIKNLIVTVDHGYTFDDGMNYDVVIASEVFEHVLEPLKLAANITKRMMQDSYLIGTTPNGYGPWEIKNRANLTAYFRKWNWLRHLLGKSPYIKGSGADHCQFYTKKALVRLFSGFSLRLVDFAKSDSFLTIFGPLRKNILLANIDIKLADILPYWLASGWYFVFEMKTGHDE